MDRTKQVARAWRILICDGDKTSRRSLKTSSQVRYDYDTTVAYVSRVRQSHDCRTEDTGM